MKYPTGRGLSIQVTTGFNTPSDQRLQSYMCRSCEVRVSERTLIMNLRNLIQIITAERFAVRRSCLVVANFASSVIGFPYESTCCPTGLKCQQHTYTLVDIYLRLLWLNPFSTIIFIEHRSESRYHNINKKELPTLKK